MIPPLQVINFPWRMLAYITPLALILVVVLADGLRKAHPRLALWRVVAVGWLASLVLLSPLLSLVVINYGYLAAPGSFPPMATFTAPKTLDLRHFDGYFLGASDGGLYGVFLPKVLRSDGSELTDDTDLYARIHRDDAGAQSLSGVPCRVTGPTRWPLESLRVKFTVSCTGKTPLALPISYNQFSSVFESGAGVPFHRIAYSHVPTDPRIVISVNDSHLVTVVVDLPTLWGMVG
jgi:hypothetical protein